LVFGFVLWSCVCLPISNISKTCLIINLFVVFRIESFHVEKRWPHSRRRCRQCMYMKNNIYTIVNQCPKLIFKNMFDDIWQIFLLPFTLILFLLFNCYFTSIRIFVVCTQLATNSFMRRKATNVIPIIEGFLFKNIFIYPNIKFCLLKYVFMYLIVVIYFLDSFYLCYR